MAIPLLNLDDRTFNDINDELRALIPRYAPAWTNHNTADPGITVMELFAWLTEAIIYRLNRVPDTSRRRFMELLGATHLAAQPALLRLRVHAAPSWQGKLPRYTQLLVYPDNVADPIAFETLQEVEFTADRREHILNVRQTALLKKLDAGRTTGVPHQLLRLDEPFALPTAPFPRPPQVSVDGERWQYVASLRQSKPTDHHFTVKPRTNMVLFGAGQAGKGPEGTTGGAIPPRGAAITASWRTALAPETWQRSRPIGTSTGSPNQLFRLPEPVLALDLQPPSDLQPQLTIGRESWDYCSSLLDSAPSLPEFIVEPWSNGLRLGDGVRGRLPGAGDCVTVTYRTTLGAIEPIEQGAYFAFMVDDEVSTSLQVLAHTLVSTGADGTALDGARQAALTLLKQPWRGITPQDLGSIILSNQRDTFSLQSVAGDLLPANNPSGTPAQDEPAYVPAQIGIVVTPQPRYVLTAPPGTPPLGEPIAVAPDGSQVVTSLSAPTARGNRLWNLAASPAPAPVPGSAPGSVSIGLPPGHLRDLAFTPDGARLLLTTNSGDAWLYDTAAGKPIKPNAFSRKRPLPRRSPRGAPKAGPTHGATHGAIVRRIYQGLLRTPVAISLLSPDGSRWLTVSRQHRYGTLRLPDDGSICGRLNIGREVAGHIIHAAFSPDNTLLAAAHAAPAQGGAPQVVLYNAADGTELVKVLPAPPSVAGLAFSPDSRILAVEHAPGAEAALTLYRAKDGGLPWLQRDRRIGTLTLPAPLATALGDTPPGAPSGASANLVFSPTGTRLLTLCADGAAYLWSLRTCTQVARLAHTGPTPRPITGAFYSADGSRLATCDRAGHICVWRAQPGTLEFDFDLGVPAAAAAFNAGAACLAAVGGRRGEHNAAAVWDLRRAGTPLLQRAAVTDTAIYPGTNPGINPGIKPGTNTPGRWLAWIEDNLVTVWDIENSCVAATLHHGIDKQRQDTIDRVHFAWQTYPGPLLTTVAEDTGGTVRRIRVWNAQGVRQVQGIFDDRHLITSQLQARGPAYTHIGIQATLVRALPPRQSRAALAGAVTSALLQFFDPLTGGPDGRGWQLGRPVYRSEVYQVLERTRGIDHVESLAILALDAAQGSGDAGPTFGDGQAEQVDIGPHRLVNCIASAVTITVCDPEHMPFIVPA